MNSLLVIDIPGLARGHLKHMPRLTRLANEGAMERLEVITPAVTCSVQSTFLVGKMPSEHGVIANGWYFRDLNEVFFWRQSNTLVSGEKVWEAARKKEASFTCANLFWWFNMNSSVDYSVTPRPMYTADGRKIPDCHSSPPELRDELTERFGAFPLFQFWGPGTNIASTSWIRKASLYVMEKHSPDLTLVYLPHLDYNLQRLGPNDPAIVKDLQELDEECGILIDHAGSRGQKILVLSEYIISEVNRPVHLNCHFREIGLLKVRVELGRELLDFAASSAFAVCDHQVAHIYIRDKSIINEIKKSVMSIPGVEKVLDQKEQKARGLYHQRSGELLALAKSDSWFTWYYWHNDDKAPDYARTVDIHRKPGYDPVELFIDPKLRFPSLQIAWRLFKKKLGFRTLLDVIPLDASLVRGSHGRTDSSGENSPVIISSEKGSLGKKTGKKSSLKKSAQDLPEGAIHAVEVKSLMLDMIFKE